MRGSPSIIPASERDVYLVLDDFGTFGSAWRETNAEDMELESVIHDLLEGQYRNPVRVVGLNLSEGRTFRKKSPGNCAGVAPIKAANHVPATVRRAVLIPAVSEQMTTASKLLARKQRLLHRLQEDPGPNEREEIARLLADINEALNWLEEAGRAITSDQR